MNVLSLYLCVSLSLFHAVKTFAAQTFSSAPAESKGNYVQRISQYPSEPLRKQGGKKTSVCGLGFTDLPPEGFFFSVPLVSQQRLICLDYFPPLI